MAADIEQKKEEKPGEFLLVLILPKDTYRPGESMPVTLRFDNVGKTTITLDGILPQRSDADPPYLEIESWDWRLIRVETGIPRELMNDKPIVVEPGKSVVLLQVDLMDVGGWIRSEEGMARGDFGKEVARLRTVLHPGKYSIAGHFRPSPRHYQGSTEGVLFKVI